MADLTGQRLGQYEVADVIGTGGMATVYRARQASMDREVAIKVINDPLAANPDFVARFEREARLIARLQHAHILPVYDFGRENGQLYLVMRLVDGGSLDKRLRSGPLPLAQTTRLFTQIASALTYAHQEGVVHRDLKPNNILLDKHGDPYLTDFGIAKLIQGGPGLTATGAVMGTPSYMAPEQWTGANIDARADIYALGVMLYEMVTGELPFTGETPHALMYKHLDVVPPSATRINPGLPAGVEAVIQKALSKDREQRFPSADAMAEALNAAYSGTSTRSGSGTEARTFVTGQQAMSTIPLASTTDQPLPTRRSTPAGLPRRRLMIGGALAVLLAILVGAGLFLTANRPGFRLLQTLKGPNYPVTAVAWRPDGSQIAAVSEDKMVSLWTIANAAKDEAGQTLRGHTGALYFVAWSPDGSQLASGGDASVRLWNPSTGANTAIFTIDSSFSSLDGAWSPDGTRLAVSFTDAKVRIYDVASQTVLQTLQTDSQPFTALAWSPDGKKLATSSGTTSVGIWDVASGGALTTFTAHDEGTWTLDWSRDGSKLASGSHDGTVRVWDMTRKDPLALLTIKASVGGASTVRWSPDGKQLAASSGFTNLGATDDYNVNIWDGDSGKLIITLEGTKPVRGLSWTADGSKLATGSNDNMVRIWGR